MKRMGRKFFNRDTVIVAQDLLGKYLVRRVDDKIFRVKIVETEAYCGPNDLANHASKGLTPRTKVMFGPPGHAYIYLIYGMYHCLNIVTEKEGYPAAVLIRGVKVYSIKYQVLSMKNRNQKIPNTKYKILNTVLNGPGILCRELKIDRNLNEVDVCQSRELWIEDGEIKIKKSQIKNSKRIGVDYAGKWKNKLWRFYI